MRGGQQWFPAKILSLSSVKDVAVGWAHSAAVDNFGNVWTTGWNNYGQLGTGTTTDKNMPVQVAGVSGAKAVALGLDYTLVLKSDGTVCGFGYNGVGQLGVGTTSSSLAVVSIPSSVLSGVVQIAAHDHSSYALKSDGTLGSGDLEGVDS